MIDKKQITIVLPTLNEEKAVGIVIDEIRGAGFDKILVMDGYSKDRTVQIAKEKGANVIIQHGSGKSDAIETAVNSVDTPYLVLMDCDHTYDPGDIQLLLNHAERFDMIIGARKNGAANIPLTNRLGNKIITKTFNLLIGRGLTDVCSGMYLLRTEAGKKLDYESRGFSVEVELASQFELSGRITEVPVSYRPRIGNQKLSRWKDGILIFYTVLKLARKHNPVFLFGAASMLAFIPATIILLWVLYESMLLGIWHSGYALFGVMLLLLASQGLTVATVSILLKRIEKRIMDEIKVGR